jgi:hypothetical protein
MRALQVGAVLSVLARIVEYADRVAGCLSCRLQLCFQALQLGRPAPSRAAPTELKFAGVDLLTCDPCFANIAAVYVEFQMFYCSGRCRSLQ